MGEVETNSKLIRLSRETGLSLEELREMTPQQQGLAKARANKRLRQQAQEAGLDPAAFVAMTPDERQEALMGARDDVPPEEEDNDGFDEMPVYADAPEVPPDDPDPLRRNGITVGPVRELHEPPPDLAGDKKPRTLVDLYARWPVGDQEHYLRVERKQPKTFQGVAVAGHLTNLFDRVTEHEFARRFGGREFEVTLYGPDPHGKSDPMTGVTRVKPLTDPISITVPMLPPVLGWHPPPKEEQMNFSPYNGGPPTTEADAKIHRGNIDLVTNVLSMQGKAEAATVAAVAQMGKATIESVRDDAARREQALQAQLESARKESSDIRQELNRVHVQLQDVTGRREGSALELVRTLSTESSSRDEQRQRHFDDLMRAEREKHTGQMDALEKRYEEKIRSLEERQELKIAEIEARAKAQVERAQDDVRDERKRCEELERRLREELERERRTAKEAKEDALREAKERHAENVASLEKGFARELSTTKTTLESEIRSTRETIEARAEHRVTFKDAEIARLNKEVSDLRQQLADAQQDLKDANDPVKVAAKVNEQAAAFGFEKKEAEQPKGFDLFMSMAGSGIGQFLGNADKWVPELTKLVGERRGTTPAPQITQGQQVPQQRPAQTQAQPQQQIQQAPAQSPRVATWASAASRPAPVPPPPSPQAPPPPAQPQQPPPPQAQPQPQQPPVQPPPQAPPPAPPPQAQPQAPQAPQPENPFREFLPDELVGQVIGQLEAALNMQYSPEAVVDRVLADPNARPIFAGLLGKHTYEEFMQFLKQIPATSLMGLRRRKGEQFLEAIWKTGARRLQAAPPAPANAPES